MRNKCICVNSPLETLYCFPMLSLFPKEAGMFNGCGLVPELRCMENSIEGLMEGVAFPCKSGASKPRRRHITLSEGWAARIVSRESNSRSEPLPSELHGSSPYAENILLIIEIGSYRLKPSVKGFKDLFSATIIWISYHLQFRENVEFEHCISARTQ